MGLGYALDMKKVLRFQRAAGSLDENFDTYEIPRFSWLRRLETVLVEARDLPPQEAGSPRLSVSER